MVGVRCVALLALPGIVACGAPDISFTDGGSGSRDATTYDVVEGDVADGGGGDQVDAEGGGLADADAGGCPLPGIEGGVCCPDAGASGLWCGGACTPSDCAKCEALSSCGSPGDLCCIKSTGPKQASCRQGSCP
jgi:hypothetical protein